MTDSLDISKLIEAAEELVGDGMLEMAEQGTIQVHEIEIDGRVYELALTAKLKTGGQPTTEQDYI